jgi:hypothetical protein
MGRAIYHPPRSTPLVLTGQYPTRPGAVRGLRRYQLVREFFNFLIIDEAQAGFTGHQGAMFIYTMYDFGYCT